MIWGSGAKATRLRARDHSPVVAIQHREDVEIFTEGRAFKANAPGILLPGQHEAIPPDACGGDVGGGIKRENQQSPRAILDVRFATRSA